MLTTTRQTKAARIDRTISLSTDDAFGPTVIGIVFEKRHLKTKCNCTSDAYILERIKCDIGGLAVLVRKMNGAAAEGQHHVHLDAIIGDSCTCEAGTYKGACRHLEMCREANRRGLV
ncbi:MAG TPA: hypothetical protein VH575_25205 [Gemmataceae bacterium]|jgi:hypothetical protein